MKAKKLLAVLLVAVMLLVPASSLATSAGEAIVSGPIKTVYTDAEYFNPQGLIINYEGKDIEYSPVDSKFAFMPGLNEHLKVDGGEIDVYYDNVKIGTVTVTVSHIWGEITYLDNNFHGRYCLGCGAVDAAVAHNVSEFIPNDDGGLLIPQTQTGVCSDCHAEITESIPGSEKFVSIFDPENMTETEGVIVEYIQMILITLIQMLAGIK